MDIGEEISQLLGGVLQDEDLVIILTVNEGGKLIAARRGSILEAVELLRQTEDKATKPRSAAASKRTYWDPSKSGTS